MIIMMHVAHNNLAHQTPSLVFYPFLKIHHLFGRLVGSEDWYIIKVSWYYIDTRHSTQIKF